MFQLEASKPNPFHATPVKLAPVSLYDQKSVYFTCCVPDGIGVGEMVIVGVTEMVLEIDLVTLGDDVNDVVSVGDWAAVAPNSATITTDSNIAVGATVSNFCAASQPTLYRWILAQNLMKRHRSA